MINYKKLLKVPGYFLTLLCIFFLLRVFLKSEINWNIIDKTYLVIAIIFFSMILIFSMVLNSLLYNMLLHVISGVRLSKTDTFNMYMKSNFAKYLPGNVMQFVGRNILCKKYNISHRYTALSTIIELIIICFSSLSIVFFMALFISDFSFIKDLFSIINIKLTITIVVIGVVITIYFIYSVLKKRFSEIKEIISFNLLKTIFLLIITNQFFLIVLGIIFYNIITNITNDYISNDNYLYITILFFNLSWLVGFITPGAPGGVGIREFTMVVFLSPFFGKEIILLASIVFRLINGISDLILFVISFIIPSIHNQEE